MSKIEITIEQLNALQPSEIVRQDNVRDKFIQIYEAMWTPSTGVGLRLGAGVEGETADSHIEE